MLTCVIYRARSAPPAEMLPMMLEGTKQWIDRYGEKFDTLWWFESGGGIGIMDAGDGTDLMQMMAEHPFTPYSDVEVHAVVDPRTGVDLYGRVLADQMAAMQAAGGS